MSKCILLIRVSTEVQDFIEQENVVRQAALRDGFTADQIISIADKESAIKLSEDERHGLNEMKRYIENDTDIKAVYCFELDRISRQKKTLFSVIDFLTERKVNLIILEPSRIELLNKDGSINDMAELCISLFAQLAQAEMRNKLARFKRSKAANKRVGKYSGGQLPDGYIKDKDGYLQPDPNNYIIDIFNMYKSGDMSYKDIALEMQSRGIFTNLSVYSASKRVGIILNDRRYIGEPSRRGVVLPPLIPVELFEQCDKVGESKQFITGFNVKKKQDRTKLLKGIIYSENNHSMYVNVGIDRYVDCFETFSVSKSVIDRAVWFVIAPLYSSYLVGKQYDETTAYENEIASLYQKIRVCEVNSKELNSQIDTINWKIFVEKKIKESRGDEMIKSLSVKIKDNERQITLYKTRISELEILKSNQKTTITFHNVDDIFRITDETIRYDICHELIERITVAREKRRLYQIAIRLKTGQELKYRVNTQTSALEVEPDEWVKV